MSAAEITNTVIKKEFTQGAGPAFNHLVATIWRLSLITAGLVVFIYFIWGSFEWLIAGGDSEKISKAQKRLTNSMIGFILLLSVVAILKFLMPLIGLNIFCPINWKTLSFQCS